MQIAFFCPRWGFEEVPWEKFIRRVKEAGYAGIEWFPFVAGEEDSETVVHLLQEYGLQHSIVMTVTGGPYPFEQYLSLLKRQLLTLAATGGARQAPLFISAQTGREYFPAEEVDACLACCDEVSRQTGVPVYQETHRNKWAYAAHVVLPVLKKHPQLLLTLDISHWFCVSESYLEDQQDAVRAAVSRARHIHARVGHTQGPQVKDPADPRYGAALAQHLAVWDKWVESREKEGAAVCTVTPEFGPPPYMAFEGDSRAAREEQWRLNRWMKTFLENRYSNRN